MFSIAIYLVLKNYYTFFIVYWIKKMDAMKYVMSRNSIWVLLDLYKELEFSLLIWILQITSWIGSSEKAF